jgi:uncharacterized membrane protein YcaP (DUF421 family)
LSDILKLVEEGLALTATKASEVSPLQAAARAVLVYGFAIGLIRVGDRRLLGGGSPFDMLLAMMIGTILSRGITATAPLSSAVAAAVALVAAHRAVAALAVRFHGFSRLVKGNARTLIQDGEVREEELRRAHIGHEDLKEGLRTAAKTDDPSRIQLAVLERNGKISAIPKASGNGG